MTSWPDRVMIHAVLMLLGWGFFIPVGTFVSSHLHRTYRQREFGVYFHVVVSIIGFVLALAGFGYGIKNFHTLEGIGGRTTQYDYAHAVIGTIATAMMIIQILLMAIMRIPKDEADKFEGWPLWRKIGHVTHRYCGFLSLYLALVSMEMGTHLYNSQIYSAAFIGTLTAAVLVTVLFVRFAKRRYRYVASQDPKEHQVNIEQGVEGAEIEVTEFVEE